jgi:hypothetical protein
MKTRDFHDLMTISVIAMIVARSSNKGQSLESFSAIDSVCSLLACRGVLSVGRGVHSTRFPCYCSLTKSLCKDFMGMTMSLLATSQDL